MFVSDDGTIRITEISLVGTGKWTVVRQYAVVRGRFRNLDPNAMTKLTGLLTALGLSFADLTEVDAA